MKIKSLKQKDYLIPELNDNKNLSKDKQIRVNYSGRPSVSEVRQAILMRSGKDTSVEDEHEIVLKYVKSIDNCETEIDGKVATANELLDAKESLLIYLTVEIINDLLSIGDFKPGE